MAIKETLKKINKEFGVGWITGAADDDPSGIATYSIAGAAGYQAFLWLSWLTLPLMYFIQEICARIALVNNKGLTGVIKEKLHPTFLFLVAGAMFFAVTFNIAADLSGMAATLQFFLPFIPAWLLSILISLIIILIILLFSYQKFSGILKTITLIMLSYVAVAFIIKINWPSVIYSAVWPKIKFDHNFFSVVTAIIGTTISPYLFFWQADEEVEEIDEQKRQRQEIPIRSEIKNARTDTFLGMFFSNLLMFFIILTTGVILSGHGQNQIQSLNQLVLVLKPLAGNFSYLLFTLGIFASGLVAIPVLAGANAYIVSEIFNLPASLNKKVFEAIPFYALIVVSILFANLINLFNISPIKLLFDTALLYGLIAPFLILVLLKIANDKKIMAEYKNNWLSNSIAGLTVILMFITIFLTL
ncbi:MAG: divalent metal cation transporter [Patescibacteria group bacterium]|nr:divalent metal cation transporter [Patescibacteria group bacterium]